MGVKYEGGDIFEETMRALMNGPEATPEVIERTAEPLIRELLRFGWDNADGTLGLYQDNPAIVAAFKANGVLLFCEGEHPDDGEPCDGLGRGHEGPHQDCLKRTWSDEEKVT